MGISPNDVNPPPSICDGCNSAIEDGTYVNAFGAFWHPQCLCCLHCYKPISMHEILKSKKKFHRSCYNEYRRPKCYVCSNKIPTTEEGIKYNVHPFWEEKYCPSHDYDGTTKCCSCERLESYGAKYIMLRDGRWLCLECMKSAVMDTYEGHHMHLEMLKFFEGLNMKVEKEFPLYLVGKQVLNKTQKEHKSEHPYGEVTRGICLSEEHIGVTSVPNGSNMGPNKQIIGMATESQMVVRECKVTAILILNGLHKFLTGYILAHEMMHAYLRLNGYRNLNTVMEEGLCQVVGHRWLESQRYALFNPTTSSSSSSLASSSSYTPHPAAITSKKGHQYDFEKKFMEFCKYQIETDDSPVYGLGFKIVNKMMISNHYNIKDTLREIQHQG